LPLLKFQPSYDARSLIAGLLSPEGLRWGRKRHRSS